MATISTLCTVTKKHLKRGDYHVRSLFIRSPSRFTKRRPFLIMFWRFIRISSGIDKTLSLFCSTLFVLRVLKPMKASVGFEEQHYRKDLYLDCHWHVFSHKCHNGCCCFSLSFWSCLRIDVFSQTSGLPNIPRVSPISPLRWPSGDITAVNRCLLNFSPHRFIWQKLKHDLWLLEGIMSMAFADPSKGHTLLLYVCLT